MLGLKIHDIAMKFGDNESDHTTHYMELILLIGFIYFLSRFLSQKDAVYVRALSKGRTTPGE